MGNNASVYALCGQGSGDHGSQIVRCCWERFVVELGVKDGRELGIQFGNTVVDDVGDLGRGENESRACTPVAGDRWFGRGQRSPQQPATESLPNGCGAWARAT